MRDATAHLKAPPDFRMYCTPDNGVQISATITTTQEAEAVREIILLMSKTLTSHREMVRADIHGPPPPKPPFSARLEAMFGIAQGIEARQGGDACGSVHESPVSEGNAP